MSFVAGYGTGQLHLGQTFASMRSLLGMPSKRRKHGTLRDYWVYRHLKFEAIVSQKTGRLLSLFFHQGCPYADPEVMARTESAVLREMGRPSKDVSGLKMSDGEYFPHYMSYDSGISFFFAQDGRIKTVCITARRRAVRAKETVSLKASSTRAVAAMRRP